ncbi:MAG TPA: MurR/RpiR family transcriptional regulator [Paenirhodobacter sp.]
MEAIEPPQDYEELIRLIHDRHDQMSKTYQRIAVYLTQNPNDVAVRSVNAIAEHCGIHASSFVRFAQSLGYRGFRELQSLFRKRLANVAPGFEARVRILETELKSSRDRNEVGFLSDLVVRDIASLQELLKDLKQEDLALAAELMHKADTIYLIGQMRSLPVVELMRYQLTMIGKRCILLDSAGGLSTYVARTITPRDLLFAVSFRFYAKEVVNIVEELGARGIDIVAISDSTLSPLAKSARVLMPVPEHDYTFSRSLAAPMCLAQALVISVAARVQHNDTPRIPTVTGS